MASTVTIDLRHVARGLDIPLPAVQAVVELLDDGNTVPFITRYRKDRTGGLDEVQIRLIQSRLAKMRLLAERKQTILRSIEAQGKLDEKLARQIQSANTTKRLEDLYLPFKPKKQTLATQARARGLEPLAREILQADPLAADLDQRAADFVSTDRQVPTAADALLGAGHILAEQFSEMAELRHTLREILQRSGKLISVGTAAASKKGPPESAPDRASPGRAGPAVVADAAIVATAMALAIPVVGQEMAGIEASTLAPEADGAMTCHAMAAAESPDEKSAVDGASFLPQLAAVEGDPVIMCQSVAAAEPVGGCAAAEVAPEPVMVAAEVSSGGPPVTQPPARAARNAPAKPGRLSKAELKKKKEEQRNKAFADYYQFEEEVRKVPPHRVLAINRGERARVLRVKLEGDLEAMHKAVEEAVVPPDHPHAALLRGCAADALVRLILPSLEREIRRELTERAELHAVDVFARNLRKLLLQPPIRDRRLLAVDPGFKSGCKLAALDQFGNVLEHTTISLTGKADRRQEAAAKVVDFITRLDLQVIVVGNGTACRETENFMAELIGKELAGRGVVYVIVNEAGASVYSTSPLGREEFPQHDAGVRSAISIGRRLLDPLSELVKIDAANIGVGLYQHDVKAKHLGVSLDEVVESCVNYVGVDVNTASPALLRYVSGMNQLTARRLYEHRRQNGAFRNRAQLKEVPGIGEATFVQAAGFLKIADSDNLLDATWIHPESYEAAGRVMEKLGCTPADLADKQSAAVLAEKAAALNLDELAQELGVGLLTLRDIVAQLLRPGRDPREDLPRPIFKQGVLKLEDLSPGMELSGTILNVVDFGAFVDIGVHHSGLIHVSHLADKFVRDPHEVISVGDVVRVWVLEVDRDRRRVSLTMIPPGTERSHGRPRPQAQPRKDQPTKDQPQDRPGGSQQESRPPRPPRPSSRPPRPPRPPQKGPPRPAEAHGGRSGPAPRFQRPPPPKPRPAKPLTPLTDEMKAGKAPLRTFGDLLQFYEMKDKPPAADAEPKPQETPPQSAETPPEAVNPESKPADQ